MVYNIDVTGADDINVQLAERVLDFLNRASLPGHYLVDVLGIRTFTFTGIASNNTNER